MLPRGKRDLGSQSPPGGGTFKASRPLVLARLALGGPVVALGPREPVCLKQTAVRILRDESGPVCGCRAARPGAGPLEHPLGGKVHTVGPRSNPEMMVWPGFC